VKSSKIAFNRDGEGMKARGKTQRNGRTYRFTESLFLEFTSKTQSKGPEETKGSSTTSRPSTPRNNAFVFGGFGVVPIQWGERGGPGSMDISQIKLEVLPILLQGGVENRGKQSPCMVDTGGEEMRGGSFSRSSTEVGITLNRIKLSKDGGCRIKTREGMGTTTPGHE